MGPSNVMPYYLRADQEFDEQDISISTIVTVDRFPVLSRLASRYKGMYRIMLLHKTEKRTQHFS